jgi:gluconate 2-dehydrogenase gamma chain
MALLPDLLAARQHAHAALTSGTRQFEFFDQPTAADVETLCEQIVPETDGPGAKGAGVVYFIDRALATFAADSVDEFRAGMAETNKKRTEMFPASTSIAVLTHDQQMQLMSAIQATAFFDLLRTLTVFGFLGEPSYGGNKDRTGWKQIGFEPQMAYQHPFGFYDDGAYSEASLK